MTSSFVGMDPTAVRQLAAQLNQKADEIQSISQQLTSQLGNVQWVGNDANRFRDDWNSTHRNQLQQVSTALHDAASAATNNATQQEQASAT
jgi:uncharacterized protein YukE